MRPRKNFSRTKTTLLGDIQSAINQSPKSNNKQQTKRGLGEKTITFITIIKIITKKAPTTADRNLR